MNLDIYIICIFIILALIIKKLPINKDKNKIFINIGFIILFLILIIREPYSDMVRYVQVFKKTSFETFPEILKLRWEKLYLVLNLVISIFTNSERIFIIIMAVLGLIGPYIFMKRYSKNYIFSLMFFVILGLYNYNFYIIRQALAISVLLLGIKYIEQKSLWKFLGIVLLATCLHKTSIVFIVAYPLCNIKLNIKGIIIYTFTAITVLFTNGKIVELMYKLSLYDSYSGRNNVSDGKGRLLLLILIFFAMLVINYMNHKEELNKSKIFSIRKKEDSNTIFFNMLMIGILFQLLAIEQSVIVRLGNIFVSSVIVLIPNITDEIENIKFKKICYIGLLCSIILYSIFIPTIRNYII